MTGPTLRERLRDAGLSAWELGDLLGIHPHLVSDPHPLLTGRPARVLIEIARRLDIHPADLVPNSSRCCRTAARPSARTSAARTGEPTR